MTQTASTTNAPALTPTIEDGTTLVLERVFAAPRELVFAAFTQAEHLRSWWGPRGWTLPVCTVDLRPGGRWHYCMKCEDEAQGEFYGMESWGLAVYDEIQAPERLVYTDYFSDAEGQINAAMPATRSTVLFESVPGGTRVVTRAAYDSQEALKTVMDMGMVDGILQTWGRLAEHLAAQGG